MSTKINDIAQRYWSGETTQEEENLLQAYLESGEVADEHLDLAELFSFFKEQRNLSYTGALDMDKIYSSSLSPMQLLVEKYLDAETSLEEEKELMTYLNSDEVSEEHKDLVPMVQYFDKAQLVEYKGDLEKLNKTQTESSPAKVRYFFPKVVSIAASLALLMMVAFNFLQEDTASYEGKYTELQDPEEALELTKEALAFLGMEYDKGTASMKYIKELEKTNVFNFKN